MKGAQRFVALWAGLLTSGVLAAEPQVTEGFVNAPVATVWRIFTTSDGLVQTGVAQAAVDLRIGGEIRAHYDPQGRLGDPETIVNAVLAYEPQRMLALRVKQAPAKFPHREALANIWTVLYFTPSGEDMTHVRIVGLGYSSDAASQGLREYFETANRQTLDHIAKQYWPQCALCKAEGATSGSD
jgi:uncharacterized protein YndB with AHSA1/START domain